MAKRSRIKVMAWEREDETHGFDIIFPDGPILGLSPKQARELVEALDAAIQGFKVLGGTDDGN